MWWFLAALCTAGPAAAQPAWKLSLNASESWDTNVRLEAASSGRFVTRVSGKLGGDFKGPRWQLGLNGSASKSFQHSRSSGRGGGGILAATGVLFGYEFSERASLSVQDNFRSSFSGEFLDFTDQEGDVLLPGTGQKRNHLRSSLSVQVSALTTATLSGTFDTALFEPTGPLQPRLSNGDRLSGSLGLSRKLNTENALNLHYTLAHSDQTVTSAYIHALSAGFSHVLGEFTTMGVSIGASRRAAAETNYYALNGGAAISRELEHSSLSLRYGRNLGPIFGLGRDVVHDSFRLSGQRTLTRDLSCAAAGTFSRNRDPLDTSFSYNAWSANGHLNFSLFRSLQLNGSYSFFKRTPLPGELGKQFVAHRAALQLGWNTAF